MGRSDWSAVRDEGHRHDTPEKEIAAYAGRAAT